MCTPFSLRHHPFGNILNMIESKQNNLCFRFFSTYAIISSVHYYSRMNFRCVIFSDKNFPRFDTDYPVRRLLVLYRCTIHNHAYGFVHGYRIPFHADTIPLPCALCEVHSVQELNASVSPAMEIYGIVV